MIRAADAADEAAADIRTKAQSLVSDMMSRSAQFQGGAGTAFRNVLQQFVTELNRDVLQRLEDLSAKTRQSANKTFSQDEVAAAEINAQGNNFRGGMDSGLSGHGSVTAGLS